MAWGNNHNWANLITQRLLSVQSLNIAANKFGKLGASDFKCKDWYPETNRTF